MHPFSVLTFPLFSFLHIIELIAKKQSGKVQKRVHWKITYFTYFNDCGGECSVRYVYIATAIKSALLRLNAKSIWALDIVSRGQIGKPLIQRLKFTTE